MKRLAIDRREDWLTKLEELGFAWHSPDGAIYWDESACYEFSMVQIEEIETASAELYRLYIAAAEDIIKRDLFGDYGIPHWAANLIRKTWDSDPPALHYGRFDLGYDGKSPPKLFEFNCDTPTSLYEAAVVQWNWKDDVFPMADQFNRIHEALIEQWGRMKPRLPDVVHFTASEDPANEDILTTTYLGETAADAGIFCLPLLIGEVGWNEGRGCFVDMDEKEIKALYKLYPWEWLINEEFSEHIPKTRDMIWLEPIYKMLWSNKRVLAHLWEMFPDHPNLLPAYLTPNGMDSYAVKPVIGREGANVTIVDKGAVRDRSASGVGVGDKLVYQKLYDLPVTDGGYPVIGSWIVGGEPVGMGIREAGLITDNKARFIPHIIR
jgi:glutathionylspermidine synthase